MFVLNPLHYCFRMVAAPEQVSSLASTIRDVYPSSYGPGSVELEVLLAESNQGAYTFDGVVWCGERLVVEVCRF
jgi:hypothetical protein